MSIFPNTDSGYLEIILGPMFSGKTSRLIEIYNKCQISNIECVIINHVSDDRFTDQENLVSHDGKQVPCILTDNIYKIIEDIQSGFKSKMQYSKAIYNAKVILINEGQFFNDIRESVLALVEQLNKYVYVCGLDGDFKRNKFGNLLYLIPYCDKVIKLPSLCKICQNGKIAVFSHRIKNSLCQKLVGDVDSYVPLCRKCYLENNLTLQIPYQNVISKNNSPSIKREGCCI